MLSKSKYCAFSQCPKRLWLQTYHPELSEDNTALDARMETGNEVGDLAMGLFGDFTEVTVHKEDGRLDLSKMLDMTAPRLSEILNEKREPTYRQAQKIARTGQR